ncbi:hypothetical protein BDV19DRAFT_389549 [Aspergillus venezuelensis]
MAQPTFDELQEAAGAVIGALKGMPGFNQSRIVVIGGLGIWKHIRSYRSTMDVDLMITVHGAPKDVKDRLLAIPNGPFAKRAEFFVYITGDKKEVQVDICPYWMGPYLPDPAMRIAEIPPGYIPYLTELDLLVFKVSSCGLRANEEKKLRDANDAYTLALVLKKRGPIRLSTLQETIVRQGLAAVVERSPKEEGWWRTTLNIP